MTHIPLHVRTHKGVNLYSQASVFARDATCAAVLS
jgi:hypothetical protein